MKDHCTFRHHPCLELFEIGHPAVECLTVSRGIACEMRVPVFGVVERAGPAAVFLPPDRASALQALSAFELEKAAYELEYELNNRPDWAAIPLRYLAEAAVPSP